MPFTSQYKDKCVAPKISSFTEASIPGASAISSENGHWLLCFMLNTGLRVELDDLTRQTLYNFIRRTEAAFREYEAARRMTLAYLDNPNPDAVSEYIVAVGHWEHFLFQADRALAVLVRGEKVLFAKEDGSVFQRLNLLHNRTKHLESAIKCEQFPPGGTLPVWLENDGLHGVDGKLTFEEIAEILKDLALWAGAAQDPLTMRDAINAAYRLNDDKGAATG